MSKKTKTEHTPGPWAWRNWGGNWCLTGDHGHRPIVLDADVVGKTELPVLRMRDAEGIMCQLTPDHPNARLIAAAPEMLEALKRVKPPGHRAGDCYSDDYMGKCVCGLEIIEAAIAKAEGTDPDDDDDNLGGGLI